MPNSYLNPDNVFKLRFDGNTMPITSTGGKMIHDVGVKDGNRAGADMGSQVRAALENISKMLEAGGATMADVVNKVAYVTDVNAYLKEGTPVYTEFLEVSKRPGGALVDITRLADTEALVEIECMAVLD